MLNSFLTENSLLTRLVKNRSGKVTRYFNAEITASKKENGDILLDEPFTLTMENRKPPMVLKPMKQNQFLTSCRQ